MIALLHRPRTAIVSDGTMVEKMIRLLYAAFFALGLVGPPTIASAQSDQAAPAEPPRSVRVATVTRPPFSMETDAGDTGFSLDLWAALSEDLGLETEIVRTETFGEMLDLVRSGGVDAAAANISITSQREAEMDFTQPIFDAGLRIMIPPDGSGNLALLRVLISRDFLIAVAAAFGLLLAVGMLMWAFERNRQPYFDRPARSAVFPSFWWALNLVVNGGFEERQPRSAPGRLLGVVMVIASLFLVSFFVAKITATLTVAAIESSVSSVGVLYGKRVGTTAGSTAADFLQDRDIRFRGFADLDQLIDAFEANELDAVVFDAPILAYYVNTGGAEIAQLVGPVFLPENYGIALPTGSTLAEPINQGLLKLRENGTYDRIYRTWFGPQGG